MEMPHEKASSDVLLDDFGEFHASALGAEPRAEILAVEFGRRQSALRAALAAREAAERTAQATEALKVRAEIDVENKIRELELSVLGSVNKKRDRDPYRRMYPKNLEGALQPIGAAQVTEGNRIANLAAPQPGTPAAESPLEGLPDDAARLGTELRGLCVILDQRVKAADAAAEAVALAFAVELSERRRWREQYRKDHGVLTGLMPSDPRTVESFFRKPPKRKKKNES